MLPDAPLPGAIDLEPCGVNDDMVWSIAQERRSLRRERALSATHRAVVRNGQRELHQLHHRGQEALRGAQTEMLDGFEDQGTLNREIGVDARCTRSCGRLRVTPCCDRLLVEPHGEAATID